MQTKNRKVGSGKNKNEGFVDYGEASRQEIIRSVPKGAGQKNKKDIEIFGEQ